MLIAVIDIGSNSVRLVFYDYAGAHAQPVFNEKETCLLGEGVTEGALLQPHAKECVRQTIRRFAELLHARKPKEIKVMATAAIRNAKDGQAFADELQRMLGHPVTILSGEEEALYAARGVQYCTYQPHGLVVDMGGGSTESAYLTATGVVQVIGSMPVGVLELTRQYQQMGEKAFVQKLHKKLQQEDLPATHRIYAVGGTFRAIASHHMKRHEYPLHIIHDYVMSTSALSTLVDDVRRDLAKNERIVGVSKRRHDGIFPALLLLQTIMRECNAHELFFSSAGIREGALYTLHPPAAYHDPLLAMVQTITSSLMSQSYIQSLPAWMCGILPCNLQEKRLIQAFSYLSDIAMTVHPDYRAEYAFERMISTLGYGLLHDEQVMLALALYHRHRAKLKYQHPTLQLLNERQRHFAYALGQCADIAYGLTAGCASLLAQYQLVRDDTSGAITINEAGGKLSTLDAMLENRRDGLGEAINALRNLSR